jgi:hypothetical protein
VMAVATTEWWWDMDGGVAPTDKRRRETDDGSASFYGFVRWLTGAPSLRGWCGAAAAGRYCSGGRRGFPPLTTDMWGPLTAH